MRKRKKINTFYKISGVFIFIILITLLVVLYHFNSVQKERSYGEIKNFNSDLSTADYRLNVKIKIIDVGQGLSVYIDAGEKELLYDCGSEASVKKVIKSISNDIDGELDYVILSHLDLNHIGGYPSIAEEFNVKEIIYGEDLHQKEFKKIYEAVKKNTNIKKDSTEVITLGDNVTINIIDIVDKDKNNKNNSVLMFLQAGDNTLLITGDADKSVEKQLNGKIPENIDILVAGNHGSATSNYFLEDETYTIGNIVFSYAKGNKNNMPSKKVIKRAEEQTPNIYHTFNGDIEFIVNGEEIYNSEEGDAT